MLSFRIPWFLPSLHPGLLFKLPRRGLSWVPYLKEHWHPSLSLHPVWWTWRCIAQIALFNEGLSAQLLGHRCDPRAFSINIEHAKHSGCALQRTQPVMPSITFSSTRTYLISFHLLIVCICLRSVGIGTLFWNCCISSTTAWHIQSRCSVNTYRMLNEFSLPPWAALHNCGCWERVSLECATLARRFFQAENNECPTNSGKVFYLPLPA